jgi:hypothetical protein
LFCPCCPCVFDWEENKRKKGIIAYNTLFGTSAMKKYVEFEHMNFLLPLLKKLL